MTKDTTIFAVRVQSSESRLWQRGVYVRWSFTYEGISSFTPEGHVASASCFQIFDDAEALVRLLKPRLQSVHFEIVEFSVREIKVLR